MTRMVGMRQDKRLVNNPGERNCDLNHRGRGGREDKCLDSEGTLKADLIRSASGLDLNWERKWIK